eukprot:XP_019927365.1 PREDICTED: uncharacterized protein LOC105339301 [Crassostrea gigas]
MLLKQIFKTDDEEALSWTMKDVEEKVLTCKMKQQEMKDVTDFLSNIVSIINGIIKSRPGDQELKHLQERMKTHRGLFDELQTNMVFDVFFRHVLTFSKPRKAICGRMHP